MRKMLKMFKMYKVVTLLHCYIVTIGENKIGGGAGICVCPLSDHGIKLVYYQLT